MREQPAEQSGDGGKPRRRQRYRGKYPRRFEQRHKELAGEAAMLEHVRSRRRTPAGTHLPVLLAEALDALRPQAGEIVIDCTVGYGGHAAAFAQTVLPGGRLIGLDVDAAELDRTANRLKGLSLPIRLHHANYAGIDKVLAQEGLDGADILFADLGVSSMQIDDPSRGMSYKHDDAPLDMRMDARRPRSAADLLNSLSQEELSQALWELADEPDHEKIAEWIVRQREVAPIQKTGQLKRLIFAAKGTVEKLWKKRADEDAHPAMRTFQALRILVNDELGALRQLLRVAPHCLRPGGRIGIISFHSGEDRLVKNAFRDGYHQGVYGAYSGQVIRPSGREVYQNRRSSSAKFRWARKASRVG